MPFYVATYYASPMHTFQPNDEQLAGYIAWLERELALAKQEQANRRPRKAKQADGPTASKIGQAGGFAAARKMTAEERKERAKKAAMTRWGEPKVATPAN